MLIQTFIRKQLRLKAHTVTEVEETDACMIVRIDRLGRRLLRCGVWATLPAGARPPGVGHIPGTALPGQSGNVALAGHRDTFLRALRNIRKHGHIRIAGPVGAREYSVETTTVVKPENLEVLAPSRSPQLTLVTCYPFRFVGSAPRRFVVRAGKVEPAKPATPEEQPPKANSPGSIPLQRRWVGLVANPCTPPGFLQPCWHSNACIGC